MMIIIMLKKEKKKDNVNNNKIIQKSDECIKRMSGEKDEWGKGRGGDWEEEEKVRKINGDCNDNINNNCQLVTSRFNLVNRSPPCR